jgi:protein TonB
MKKILTLLIFVAAFKNVNAQNPPPPPPPNESDTTVVTAVQVPASFPGGYEAWNKYLEKNLRVEQTQQYVKIPKGQKAGMATVVVTFIVDKEGNISDVKAENKPHRKLAEEAIRVVKEGPKWVPAQLNGSKVKYRHRQSITWQVSEE